MIMVQSSKVRCIDCKYYQISWDAEKPFGCLKLGFKSRSSLYSLKKHGLLDQYLCEIRGIDHLCWKPVGEPRLPEYLSSIVQWKVNGVITRLKYYQVI